MARLDKKTKAELIMMCNERGGEIEKLRKEVDEKVNVIKELNNECCELGKTKIELETKYHSLETDFKGSEDSHNAKLKELNIKYSEELQSLRDKVSERDKTISMQGESFISLKNSYDELVCENNINRNDASKYKLTTIAFIILFIIALICACI